MEEIRRKSTSFRQLQLLINFMEKHVNFAKGKLRSKEGLVIASHLWVECAGILNAAGVSRTPKQWSRVWNDYKCRLRAKVAKSTNRGNRATRGTRRPTIAQQLSPLEERVVGLLGRDTAGVDRNTSAEHPPVAADLSTAVTVQTLPIVAEHEQNAPVNVKNVDQPADQGTNLPQTVKPRNHGLRRIRRRARLRRQTLTRTLEMAAVQRKLAESSTRIATSVERIATILHNYVSRLHRNN